MKKAIMFILTVALCLSFVACGNKGEEVKITEAEVIAAFAECEGTLTTEGDADNVTAFKYVIEDINIDNLLDRDYAKEAMEIAEEGDHMKLKIGQIPILEVMQAMAEADALLFGDVVITEDYTEHLLTLVCDGKSFEANGWTVSVSATKDCAIINAIKK
ncbi:MAG: hypothetical protein IKJ63_02780 [Clostridia bacterium]|nr:hypothetical protein [Clostridia bacterium]